MFSDYYYIPELTFFLTFYLWLGFFVRLVLPSPGNINQITPYFYWMYYANMVSLVHWLLGIIAPAIVFYYYGFQMNREALYVHHLVMLNSTAYFLYDTVAEKLYGVLDIMTATHHLSVIILGAYFYWNKYGGDEYLMTLFLGELSNPCLILRTILKSLRLSNTLYFTYIEGWFAISFLLIRVLVAPFWIDMILQAENCPFGHKLGVSIVFTISMGWNTKILAIVFKRYKQLFGRPPYFLQQLENFFAKIDNGEIEYYIFYGIVMWFSVVYPLVYYGAYKQTLFLSY